ncbi:MAG: ribosome-associated translation inhibitor RaiA [Ruminococcaceae bacterium]|nr:ribosome-associated translation inhibitor RaiA [Oscillospiraceae bacterium]
MKVNVIGRQMNVWNEMKETIDAKIAKLDKYFGDDCSATVTLSSKHNQKCLEITINSSGIIFRSEVEDETFRNALDRAIYSIERQIRKNKTRLQRQLRKGAFDNGIIETNEDIEEEPEFVIREKTFALKPMSTEEAIMQMNLLGHEFFVYKNDKSGDVCVVYKRRDGAYGLINTEE